MDSNPCSATSYCANTGSCGFLPYPPEGSGSNEQSGPFRKNGQVVVNVGLPTPRITKGLRWQSLARRVDG